jgi:hypothetical protein
MHVQISEYFSWYLLNILSSVTLHNIVHVLDGFIICWVWRSPAINIVIDARTAITKTFMPPISLMLSSLLPYHTLFLEILSLTTISVVVRFIISYCRYMFQSLVGHLSKICNVSEGDLCSKAQHFIFIMGECILLHMYQISKYKQPSFATVLQRTLLYTYITTCFG